MHRHPDSDRPTLRIPFAELRTLVMSLIDPIEGAETRTQDFEMQPTTYRPRARGTPPAPLRGPGKVWLRPSTGR